MVARRIILSLLAVIFLSVTTITPVHAGGGNEGGGGDDNEIHPWDNNDDFVIGTGPILSALHRPIIWIAEVYSGRGMVIWSSQSASRNLSNLHQAGTTQKARSTRRAIRLEAGKR